MKKQLSPEEFKALSQAEQIDFVAENLRRWTPGSGHYLQWMDETPIEAVIRSLQEVGAISK